MPALFGHLPRHAYIVRTWKRQVHEIEGRAKIHNKFRFPFFKEMMLFAASKFLNSLRAEQVILDPFTAGVPCCVRTVFSVSAVGVCGVFREATRTREVVQAAAAADQTHVGRFMTRSALLLPENDNTIVPRATFAGRGTGARGEACGRERRSVRRGGGCFGRRCSRAK